MIPSLIEAHLREHHPEFEHHAHARAFTAQELAAAEHVTGYRVAKPVVVRLDGKLAIAVVAATDRVSLGTLEEATASSAELVPEVEFWPSFRPCDPGAEPPLALFGLPIFVDEKLLEEERLVMPGGTHEDAVVLETGEWLRCEQVQPVANLGVRAGETRH
ncbi:aminoacyl-tRNA deacylase [Anaeromyxobacter oryzisoli]|uniref:aminoacyl-tRNA deacylase n=1 Tax=Anaeromyxobacter oryzisoli TaxID=2925408 RepID=UPI001F5A017B|nr:YbaK/EbsC family protein [Anaeromyxobacter sp. SG63]